MCIRDRFAARQRRTIWGPDLQGDPFFGAAHREGLLLRHRKGDGGLGNADSGFGGAIGVDHLAAGEPLKQRPGRAGRQRLTAEEEGPQLGQKLLTKAGIGQAPVSYTHLDVYKRQFLYCVIGWLYEVFLEVVIYRWGFSNRGILVGPYLPIYGIGALVFLLCFGRYVQKPAKGVRRWLQVGLVFLGCMTAVSYTHLAPV